MTLLNLKPEAPNWLYDAQKSRKWMFESALGSGIERDLAAGEDVEAICCEMARITHLPTRCYPVLIETSSGRKRGEIIV